MDTLSTRAVFGARRRGRPRGDFNKPDKPLAEYTKDEVWHEGERIAARHLEDLGFDIVERNWRCDAGEADLIAVDDGVYVLVEVKSRIGSPGDVQPELAVDARKLHRYELITKYYVTENPGVHSVRFDVVAVNLISDDKARVTYFPAAAWWDD